MSGSVVYDGAMAVAVPAALFAGLLSFFSPCVLPLVPGYFSYATGLAGADIAAGRGARSRMLLGAVLFILGFGAVFVLLGVAAGTVGSFVQLHGDALTTVLGALSILLGLAYLAEFRLPLPRLQVTSLPGVGLAFAPVLGALFAAVWLPCTGPVLGTILTMASASGTALRGGLLLTVYTVGFGIPFVAAALLWRHALGAFRLVSRHPRVVKSVGGALMILIGPAMITGWWSYLTQWLQILALDFSIS